MNTANPPCHLLIPAAGSGKRMGADRNKLLLPLLGKPLLQWTLEAALQSPSLVWIGIVAQLHDRAAFQAIGDRLAARNPGKAIAFAPGGDTRQQSVENGLAILPEGAQFVLIHDGARCLATPDLFERCAAACARYAPDDGVIAAIPVKDTIKVVAGDAITDTPDRDRLWAAQTPQGFAVDRIRAAHAAARTQGWSVTDDAALFEKLGWTVRIVTGEETNLKVTTPQDLAIAEFILKQRGETACLPAS